jgi:hypothetical protein
MGADSASRFSQMGVDLSSQHSQMGSGSTSQHLPMADSSWQTLPMETDSTRLPSRLGADSAKRSSLMILLNLPSRMELPLASQSQVLEGILGRLVHLAPSTSSQPVASPWQPPLSSVAISVLASLLGGQLQLASPLLLNHQLFVKTHVLENPLMVALELILMDSRLI